MTMVIHCFSATGNSERAAGLLAAAWAERGLGVRRVNIEDGALPEGDDVVDVFVFPVLGFGVPALMAGWMRRLARVRWREGGQRRAVVFATWGGHPMGALERTRSLLGRLGWRVLSSGGALYPNNWNQVTSAPSDAERERLVATGDRMARDFAALVPELSGTVEPTAWGTRLWTGLVHWLFDRLGRFFLGTFFVADRRCNGCGLCVRHCPAACISAGRKPGSAPRWGANCLGCNRCINRCPKDCIQVSVPLALIQSCLNLGALALVIHGAGPLAKALVGTGWLAVPVALAGGATAFIVFSLFQLVVLGRALQELARLPGLRRFFALSWTAGFRRYRGP